MSRTIRSLLALLLLVFVGAGCGTLSQTGLQRKIRSDVNRYIGTQAVRAVRCKRDTTGSATRYVCVVIPTNGRKGVRVIVAVHGSTYSILTPRRVAK